MALTPDSKAAREEKAAKRKNAEEEALLREVDDAVRQGDMENFAKKYGWPLLGVFALVMAGFGGYIYWNNHRDAEASKDAEALAGALDQMQAGNLATGSEQLESLANDGEGVARASALLLRAGAALQQGNEDEAAEIYAALATDDKVPEEYRQIATLREVGLRFDDMKPADVVARLKPMAVPGEPFFASSAELVAMAYLDQKKNKEAGALFAQLAKDEDAPESLRSRARQMASVLGVDAIEDVDALLKEQGVAGDAEEAPTAMPAG